MSDKPSWNFDREETMRQLGADPEGWRSFDPKVTTGFDKRDDRDPVRHRGLIDDEIADDRIMAEHSVFALGEHRSTSEEWREHMERQRQDASVLKVKTP